MNSAPLPQELRYRAVVCGAHGVGLSSLVHSLSPDQPLSEGPVPVEFFPYDVPDASGNTHHVSLMVLQITDSTTRSLQSSILRQASAGILVYDVTSRESFDALSRYHEVFLTYANESMLLTVLGNKSDLASSRQVTHNEGLLYAVNLGAAFAEVSCAPGDCGMRTELERVVRELVQNGVHHQGITLEREPEKVGDCICGAPVRPANTVQKRA